ncbi:Guanine nucleotide exchange factor for Rab-3A [Trichinella murrelli]|uniref:Guanine nucleotide exchange factor for Rab-3A n=1 Tax=Trichinella murrelli TaxID=144512 RepID=A0A0V0UBZ3_9BILA|nr:Guanine nucleotide exchange factor for Rab-3A [Trichinella murrelli]
MAELSFCRWRISHGSIDRFYRHTSGGRLMIFGFVLARCWRSILRSKLILLLAHLVLLFLTGYGDVPHVAAKAAAKAVLSNYSFFCPLLALLSPTHLSSMKNDEQQHHTPALTSDNLNGEDQYQAVSEQSHAREDSLEKDRIIEDLQDHLGRAHEELMQWNLKCAKLQKIQESLDSEIHELTASLFQEAYRIVTEADSKRLYSEKLLTEARGTVEMLQEEIKALKLLMGKNEVKVSPSRSLQEFSPSKIFKKPTLFEGKNGGPFCFLNTNKKSPSVVTRSVSEHDPLVDHDHPSLEIDPICHQEFTIWLENHDLTDIEHPFLKRIYNEDIYPCLNFTNTKLASLVCNSIVNNTIILENILASENEKAKICALTEMPRLCSYRMKIDNADQWHYISTFCRNRVRSIAAICDLFTYLRYLAQGLVQHGLYDAYVEIVRLRRNIAFVRLGYANYQA